MARRKVAPTFKIKIGGYYLSQYPCQTNPSPNEPTPTPVIAYMTLLGKLADDKGQNADFNFYINFYPDGSSGLSAPSVDGNSVKMDMYYCQLAGIVRMFRETPWSCYGTYSPGHTEIIQRAS
jgi:hypothetical protein